MNIKEVKQFFLKRKSVRNYLDKEVDSDIVNTLVEIGYSAPKAGGIEAVEIFTLMDIEQKKLCSKAAFDQEFITKAPVVFIIGCYEDKIAKKYGEAAFRFGAYGSAACAENIAVAAANLGLGTCWVGGFDAQKLKEKLGLAREFVPHVIMPLGYQGK